MEDNYIIGTTILVGENPAVRPVEHVHIVVGPMLPWNVWLGAVAALLDAAFHTNAFKLISASATVLSPLFLKPTSTKNPEEISAIY
jgi:hypothetical protein